MNYLKSFAPKPQLRPDPLAPEKLIQSLPEKCLSFFDLDERAEIREGAIFFSPPLHGDSLWI